MSNESEEQDTSANTAIVRRRYSEEDKFIALAAVDLNGGNVYRTAVALDIPARTLADWVDDRTRRGEEFAALRNENRGNIAVKLESVLHSLIESMPAKIPKATLSQVSVATGIVFDKLERVFHRAETNPTAELCRILGCNAEQLPPALAFDSDEELQAFIDVKQVDGVYQASQSRYAHPLFGELWSTLDQDGLPPDYLRVLDDKNQNYILPANELRLMAPDEQLSDSQLLDQIPDDDEGN